MEGAEKKPIIIWSLSFPKMENSILTWPTNPFREFLSWSSVDPFSRLTWSLPLSYLSVIVTLCTYRVKWWLISIFISRTIWNSWPELEAYLGCLSMENASEVEMKLCPLTGILSTNKKENNPVKINIYNLGLFSFPPVIFIYHFNLTARLHVLKDYLFINKK